MIESPRRILVLPVSGPRGSSARYRAYQLLPVLRDSGFHVEVVPPAERRPTLRQISEESYLLHRAEHVDLVLIQKRLFPMGFIRRLAALGKPVVFDFDDALFASPDHRSLADRLWVRARLGGVLKAAACVIAGNRYLADYAAARARRVEVLPTCVDVRRYQEKNDYAGRGLNLGWIGSHVTRRHLDALQPVLAELSPKISGMQLTVVSDEAFSMRGVNVAYRVWSPDDETEAIRAFDVGLMPLQDSAWTRGNCGLKALQYMAAGVPVVCSAVGANPDLVESGVDGFLCRTDNEWREAVLRLAADPALRRDVGLRGRAKVEQLYSVEVVGRRLAELLSSILTPPSRQPA
ncbi:MAG: glycosyltransferase family 4 protein [Verrucomicrobiota bacterium]